MVLVSLCVVPVGLGWLMKVGVNDGYRYLWQIHSQSIQDTDGQWQV